MMDVTVKTLDGQNRTYNVPDNITVKQFKDRIAATINITADVQRLIFQGRVLQDDKPLTDYGVDGKVIHVVQRLPPGSRPPTSDTEPSATTGASLGGGNPGINSFVVGSFSLPTDVIDPNQVQNIVQQAMNNLGDVGRNAHVTTRSSADGLSVGVDINLGSGTLPVVASESARRIQNAKRMITKANEVIDRLENPEDSADNNSGSHSPMDTSNDDSANSQSEGATETSQSTPASQNSTSQSTSTTSTTTDSSQSTSSPTGQARAEANHPPTTVLADLLDDLSQVNTRLQPHMESYQTILRDQTTYPPESDDRRKTQRVCNLVSEVLHYISHCNHSISDLMIDMGQAPPRCLRAPPSSQIGQSATIITQAIPVEAQLNIDIQSANPIRTPNSTQAPPTPTSSTTPPASTSTGSTTTTSTPSQTGGRTSNQGETTTASSNPYMFMEVGPDSVTINSISAHVVSSSSNPNSGSTPTTASAQATPTPAPSATTSTTTRTTGNGTQTTRTAPMSFGIGPGGQAINLDPNFMQTMIQMMAQSVAPNMAGNPRVRPVVVIPGVAPGGTINLPRATAQRLSGPRPFAARVATPAPAPSTNTSTPSTRTTSSTTRPGVTTPLGGSFGTFLPGSPLIRNGVPRNPATARPHAHPPMGIPISMGQPGGGNSMMFVPDGGPHPGMGRPVDPFLPCQSRHFMTQRAQAMAQSPESSLADVVTNFVSGLIGQPLQRETTGSASTQTTAAQAGPIPANSFSALFPGATPAGGAPSQNDVPLAQLFMGALQGQQQRGASTGASSSSSTTTRTTGASSRPQASGGTPLTDEALVSGIGEYVTRSVMGQGPQDTIGEFLTRLGENHNILPGEGFVYDAFMCVATHLTFPDLMSVFYGQSQPLNRLRGPLREFVRDNVLNGIEYSPSNVQESVERLVTELQPSLQETLEGAAIRADVDPIATINNFFRQSLSEIINLILHSRSEDPNHTQFGEQLMECCRRILGEFVVLGRYSLTGGMPAFQSIVQDRLRNMMEGINPMVQQWMAAISAQQLTNLNRTIEISEESVLHYIKKPARETSPKGAVPPAQPSPLSGDPPIVRQTPRPMSYPPMGPQESMDVGSPRSAQGVPSSHTDKSPSATGGNDAGVRGDNWQRLLPADWVPVITADVEKQRRQPSRQTPYSDAYLNGMPPKRRKLMTEDKPTEDLTQEGEFIPEALKRAVAGAGVDPISSLDNMVCEASEDSSLQRAFQGHVEGMIQARLESDRDYTPGQYPSSEEYFKQPKDK